MDDLGAEHLSELSVNDKNVVKTADSCSGTESAASVGTNPTGTAKDSRAIFGSGGGGIGVGDGGGLIGKIEAKPVPTPRARYKDRAIFGGQNYSHNHNQNEVDEEEVSVSSSDGKEKTDATPENAKKIDDVIQVVKSEAKSTTSTTSASSSGNGLEANVEAIKKENYAIGSATTTAMASTMDTKTGSSMNDEHNNNNNMATAGAPQSTPNSTIADDDGADESSASSAKQQCMAFTIDFGDSTSKDANSAAAAKYKSMVERFQNRHRRGASMSKLEGADTPPNGEPPQTPTQIGSPRAPPEAATPSGAADQSVKVKMRPRDRSTSRVRDASKRHSWSPRSSTTEPPQQHANQNQNHPKAGGPPKSPTAKTPTTKKPKPKPTQLQMPPQDSRKDKSSGKPFTPRSTAMQMALQKIDFLCPQPPLDDYHHLTMNDNVSEAGTYTLDGDNYTEEQKELMNIDKTATSSEVSSGSHMRQKRPKDLPLKNTQTPTSTTTVSSSESRRRNNVLEVNYYHDSNSTSYKPTNKTSYLDKIKSRVRNITVKQQQQQQQQHQQQIKETSPPDADVGTFTSVTTSGVLAKQTTLDSRPKLTRRSSLSTSQIDSSEYVSTEAKLKSNTGKTFNGGYTDHQKAGYRLNVFTNQTDSQILSAIESPESPVSKLSDTAVLKTAQTKNDWIQEWARNARARSVASAIKGSPTKQSALQQQNEIMSRSYNCAAPGEEETLTDDSIIYRNKTIDRFRMGDFDYASDPNVSAQKPPKSPTKIPSPLHTIGRARSASHTRASLQNIISSDDPNNTDLYLQKTAAAISNLQQSLSRKNSLKSPPSSRDSPKKIAALRHHHSAAHQYYSADEYSPQHSIEAKLLITNPLHKRAANNLMSNSYHEQLVLDVKIPRARKNSYDAQALTVSPARRHQTLAGKQQQYYSGGAGNIDQTRNGDSSIKQQQQQQKSLSPLRRSSSFSAKCKTTTNNSGQQQKRPTASLYTPPALRHNYISPPLGSAPIKKSASSTTFRHVYSDYDDNVAYYINDEDDLVDVEYYGSSEEDIHSGNVEDDYEDYDDENSQHVVSESVQSADVPLTNTRYNKALLMRIERSKQKVAGTCGTGVGGNPPPIKPNLLAGGGMVACPNTPELPRRAVKSAPRSSMRQSMPRDSSLNRLADHIPNSLASAKKQILQTANATNTTTGTGSGQQKRVQPKYMDISKYKPAQGNNFLRKNDAKSTLKPEIRRSPSSASMGMSRTEPTRTSNRSAKSATSGRGTSAARRDASVTKQKEVELAMWKRRATYDPMRAAAEDRRKKEEAKKSAQCGQTGGVTESSTVTRSQSFHYGVGSLSATTPSSNQPSLENRWTLTSNESSDEERAYISSSTNRS